MDQRVVYEHVVNVLLCDGQPGHPIREILLDYPDVPSLRTLVDDPRAIPALESTTTEGETQGLDIEHRLEY